MSGIHNVEDLWQWSRLKIRLNAFRRSTIPQKQFIKSSFICWCYKHKLSKVKFTNKSRKNISHHILSFSLWVKTILIKMGSWVYILMANEVYIVIFTLYSKQSLTPLAFFENLSPRGPISKKVIWWPFPITDKANKTISLAISSGELTDLRSLVPVCTITRSGFEFPEMASQELYYHS